ncbi:MAG: M23 family metallopeptidase [Rikenellaceae bacterium]
MKFWRNIKYFLKNLTNKHRLILRNEHLRSEVWYMHISPLNAIIGLLTFVLLLLCVCLAIVSYTSILDLAPGYPGSRSREALIQNIMRIDSLEQQINNLEVYNTNMAMIMSGKSPVTREVFQDDSLRTRVDFINPSSEDSILRSQMESDGLYSLSSTEATRQSMRSQADTYPPVGGVVLSHFSPKDQRYGVSLAVTTDSEVLAVMQGTVISSEWTPSGGTVIYVQHADDMISVYRNNLSSRVQTGQRVSAGEVIGYIINERKTSDNTDAQVGSKQMVEQIIKQVEQESDRFGFELWRKGVPVDPENYIVF